MSTKTKTNQVVAAETSEETVRAVRDRYGAIARAGAGCCAPAGSCCGPAPERTIALSLGYTPQDLDLLPDGANLGLGCGAPIAHLEIQPGETVLDLGSGAGVDAILAARMTGTRGHVIGVDMTDEMIARARANASAAGLGQVEFRQGRLETLPIDSDSVDAVTSNCVINLVPDKLSVFREIHRVLRPGGRLVISDIVLDGALPDAIRRDMLAYVGCVAGAIERADYFDMLRAAGLGQIEILHDVDFLGPASDDPPEEIRALLARVGLGGSDIEGVVRSVTFRARKQPPSSAD